MARSRDRILKPTVSLLDRLTEHSVEDASIVTRGQGDLPLVEIEASLLRDLQWLLSTTSLSASRDLSRWKHVRKSVLNFGVPVFTGRVISNADVPAVVNSLRRAIEHFEPRLRKESLEVEALVDSGKFNRKALAVRIRGEYIDWDGIAPIEFRVQIDLETGQLQPLLHAEANSSS